MFVFTGFSTDGGDGRSIESGEAEKIIAGLFLRSKKELCKLFTIPTMLSNQGIASIHLIVRFI